MNQTPTCGQDEEPSLSIFYKRTLKNGVTVIKFRNYPTPKRKVVF